MANENSTQTEPKGTDPQTDPKQGEGAQGGAEGDPKPAAEGQGGGEGEVEDKHGQPGINREKFDYQSECHCSKTYGRDAAIRLCLITSQNATAPKLRG